MGELTGRSAIVTGAGKGFGRAIAAALADAGAAVTLTSRTAADIDAAGGEIERRGGRALAAAGDVMEMKAMEGVFAAHAQAFGAPSILVNCAAASSPYGPVGVVDPERWWQTQAVHVLGAMNTMTLALPQMREAGRGCIINISSMDALFVQPNNSAYAVAKATLIRLSEHVARENEATGVAVFPIHPGVAMTGIAEELLQSAEARQWMPDFVDLVAGLKAQGGHPHGTEHCGRLCVALASGRFDHLSGQFINFHEFDPAAN